MIEENAAIFRMKFWPVEKMDPPSVKRLNEIKAPALIVIGKNDTETVRMIAQIAADGISGSKKVDIQGADHMPQMVKPKEFNRILEDFLQSSGPDIN
jgi:pimeloyl-ACP methyl ester carboxylesterase